MKAYMDRCSDDTLEGLGTYLSMLWMPDMPATNPSCSALRFAQGTISGMCGMCSSLTMSLKDSR